MRRAVAVLAVLLVLAGGARAAPADASPDADLPERLSEEAEGAAEGVAAATSGAASGAGSAAEALAATLSAAGELAADAAVAVGELVAAAGSAAAGAARIAVDAAAGAAAAAGSAAASLGALAVTLAAASADVALGLAAGALEVLLGAVRDLAAAPAHRKEAAARAGVGAAASTAAWSGYRAGLRNGMLAPLYSRIGRDELLDHDVRRAIYDYVGENPGAHVSEIAEAVDVGWGTAVYHLERLSSAEIMVSESHGNHRCFFRNGDGVPEEAREAIPALKSDKARDVVAFVRENPAASQVEVADALDMSAALVSWHVSRLAESGLLEKERDGRGNALFVDDEMAGPAMKAAAA